MASLHASWFNIVSPTKPSHFSSTNLGVVASPFKPIRVLCALNPDNAESSENTPEAQPAPIDPVKIAFSKAKAYRESRKSDSSLKVEQSAALYSGEKANGKDGPCLGQNVADGGQKEVPMSVKIAMEKARKYKSNKGVVVNDQSTGANETIQGNNTIGITCVKQ